MRRQVVTALLAAASALPLLILPRAAAASTTLGEVGASGPGCPSATTVIQEGTPAGGPSYVVPSPGGVITSWTYQPGGTTDRVALVAYGGPIGIATATSSYEFLGASAVQSVPPGPAQTFLTRVPVGPGVHIGIQELDPASSCSHTTGDPLDVLADCLGCLPTPLDPFVTTTPMTMKRANVSAVLEPDVDHDGYGDQTQDQCVGDPNTYNTPCRSDLALGLSAPASSPMGAEFALRVAITNNGPSIAHQVTVSYHPPPGLHFVSGHSDSHCSGDDSLVTCTIDVMSVPSTLPTYITVVPAAQGSYASTVTVTSTSSDPDPANDVAVATTSVGPPAPDPNAPAIVLFAGLRIADNQVLSPDARRLLSVRASCPSPATARCVGTLTLRSAARVAFPRGKRSRRKSAHRILTLGSGRFSVLVGKSGTVRVKLSPTAVTILRRELSLDVVGTAAGRDGAGHTRTTTGQLVVTPPSKATRGRRKKH